MAEGQDGNSATLFCLPNEILLRTLGTFQTRELLPLTSVSCRFHDLVLRILHGRLLAAAEMRQHKLILECYHPASKNNEPYLYCDYLGTPGLSNDTPGAGLVYQSVQNIGRLGKLAGLYSRFRPIRLEEEFRVFAPAHPAGETAAQRVQRRTALREMFEDQASFSSPFPSDSSSPLSSASGLNLVEHRINLDVDEPFSQLCVATNLVRPGPRRGVFFNFVGVSDGVVRVKRNWLAKRAAATKAAVDEDDDDRTLWLSDDRIIGLRAKVEERTWTRAAPILMLRDEDPAATYNLQYEELLVRTTHLLLAVEKAILQDRGSGSGKAMIFGSFVRMNSD